MSTESNDFRDVRTLLAWKRNEQPPPGFYADFSNRVLIQIRALTPPLFVPWWERWLEWFDARPVLVGAYGIAVCGLLVTGITVRQVREDLAATEDLPAGFVAQQTTAMTGSLSNRIIRANRWMQESGSSTIPVMEYSQDNFAWPTPHLQVTPASFNYH